MDGKVWVIIYNYWVYLVLRFGYIYDEFVVKFLFIYIIVNCYGILYCFSVRFELYIIKLDYIIIEFENLVFYSMYGLYMNVED